MDILLKENERIDSLDFKDLKIIQNKNGFCFGIDSILLTNYIKKIKKENKVIDLGTGTGVIGILLCEKTELSSIVGIEIQKDVSDMASRSVKLNNLENKFTILNEDIKNINTIFKEESFDVVVTNPPYKKYNTGLISDDCFNLISRHEIKCTLEDVIKASSKLLKKNGNFYMVHKPERLTEIMKLLKAYNLEPKEIQLVYPNINKPANLVLINSVKNAKEFLKIDKPLIVYNENGNYTQDILDIYNIK